MIERAAAHLDPDEAGPACSVGSVAPHAELDRLTFGARPGERRQIGRAVRDVNAVEQAVAEQVIDLGAEQHLGGGRGEEHRAVAGVSRDDVGHVAGEQPVAVLFGVEKPEARARERFGAEREPGRVQRGGDDAERRERALPLLDGRGRGQKMLGAAEHQQAGGEQRERRGGRHHPPRGGQRRFERHDDEPDGGEGADSSGLRRHHGDETGERERGQHMRALVAARARKEIGGEDRRDQPGENHDLERARHAAHGEIDRKRGERCGAADQSRSDERAMARRRQRIALRRRMHQRVDIIADRIEEVHFMTLRVRTAGRAPRVPLRRRIVADAT